MNDSSGEKTEPPLSASNPRRRNSIPSSVMVSSTPNTKTRNGSRYQNGNVSPPPQPAPPSPIDLKLVSVKSSSLSSQTYTSLRDLLPSAAAVNSPTAVSTPNSGYEISIRNRLVKQAAWAYLQPMSASSYSSGPNFIHRIWLRFSAENPISGCLGFIRGSIIPAIIRVIRVCICL